MAKLAERRASPRFSLKVDCRFLLRGNLEGKGSLLDISESGLALITESPANEGDEIVVYPEGVGRLAGTVVRVFNGGVAAQFCLSDTQKEIIGERIASVISGIPYLRLSENRSAFRITYNIETNARIEKSDEYFSCIIVDMSRTGCLLKSDVKPEIGEHVIVGTLRGVVRRQSSHGFALEFLKNSKPASHDKPESQSAAKAKAPPRTGLEAHYAD